MASAERGLVRRGPQPGYNYRRLSINTKYSNSTGPVLVEIPSCIGPERAHTPNHVPYAKNPFLSYIPYWVSPERRTVPRCVVLVELTTIDHTHMYIYRTVCIHRPVGQGIDAAFLSLFASRACFVCFCFWQLCYFRQF